MRTTALTLLTAATCVVALATPASAAHGALVVTGLTANDRLVTFAASDPGTILSTVRITGIDGDVEAIDFRPATGELYALASTRTGAQLHVVDPATGVASRVGSTDIAVSGSLSIDFNPTVDRLRVVSDDGTNLRVNPDTGGVTVDGPLAYRAGDPSSAARPGIGDVAYTNNDADCTTAPTCPAGSTGTMLFDVDAALDQLAQQVDANGGVLRSVGGLGQPTKAQATGFDVYTRTDGARTNWAFVSLFDKGRTTFYEIDLATGQPITVTAPVPGSGQDIATRPHVTDIALAPAQPGF